MVRRHARCARMPPPRPWLIDTAAPVVAVSPVMGGRAVKGPTAKMMGELGLDVSAETIARHYEGIIDGLLVDDRDPPGALPVAHDRADLLGRHARPAERDFVLRGNVECLGGRELVALGALPLVHDSLKRGVERGASEALVELFVGYAGRLADHVPAK